MESASYVPASRVTLFHFLSGITLASLSTHQYADQAMAPERPYCNLDSDNAFGLHQAAEMHYSHSHENGL
jgi:hypothetical protein